MQPIFTPEGEQAFELFLELICGVIVFIVTINIIAWIFEKITEENHEQPL
jgi:hypothetical protein